MRTDRLILALLACVLAESPLSAQEHTERGAVLGGLSGAMIGAAIGDRNDETAEGALIGGAVGLLSGSLIGNSVDAEQARIRAWQQQRVAAQVSRAVSNSQVVSMAHNGVSDPVIINQVRQYGIQRRLNVTDVIALHKQGVSEPVITAMQQARVGGTATVSAPSAPVIIQQHHYVTPRYWVPPPRHRFYYPPRSHHHSTPHHSRVQFGFTIGR